MADPHQRFRELDLPSGVQFSCFGSFELGTDAFPLSSIPLQQIVSKVEAGDYDAKPSRVFSFEEISQAHRVMDQSQALGQLVVAGT